MSLVVLDGGMGRELARMGAPFAQPEWSALALMEGPRFVSRAHAAFIAAGADVITANSYAVTPFHIGEARFEARGRDLAALAGQLAREAADQAERPVRVAGSLPPACGSYRPDLFDMDAARPVLAALVEGLRPHVDIWLAETLSAVEEARLAREAVGPDPRPLWLSFTLDDDAPSPGEPRLRSGQPAAEAAREALALGAQAILFNCSQPEVMADALAAARSAVAGRVMVGVYANAFPPQPKDAVANAGLDEIRADLTPGAYAAFARAWRDLGADIIGGCCGVGPEHIAAVRTGLEEQG